MTGGEAYQEYGEQGFLHNPFLVGPHHDARDAAAWWREFDEERQAQRARARSGQQERGRRVSGPDLVQDFSNARDQQIAQIRSGKPRTKSREA